MVLEKCPYLARKGHILYLCPLATDQKVGSSNLPGHAMERSQH